MAPFHHFSDIDTHNFRTFLYLLWTRTWRYAAECSSSPTLPASEVLWTWYVVMSAAMDILLTILGVFHVQVVEWLQPVAGSIHECLIAGFSLSRFVFCLVFNAIFGHELFAVLCGIVWGKMPGTAILSS
ncbi:hypothetical protein BKA93DRAFT_46927 [Sparassis latifolia]